MARRLADLFAQRRVLVCAGPGGAGKTTTAAALAAVAARLGRRTLVCTIDPAPRLEDALRLRGLGGEPVVVAPEAAAALGISSGLGGGATLSAARLDTASAFARLVDAEVPDAATRERIFANPIYRQITTALTGSQEYAALLVLHDLAASGAHDLIVLDTPPTAHALDFLQAPGRIAEAVDGPLIRWLTRPARKGGIFSWQRLRAGSALVLQRLGKLVGSRFLDDVGVFLTDFQPVLVGFAARARAVEALFRRGDVGFLLVLAPEVPAVNEALSFAERLHEVGVRLDAVIANRVLVPPGLTGTIEIEQRLAAEPACADLSRDERHAAAAALSASASYVARLGEAQRRELLRLSHGAAGVPMLELPMFPPDVSGLATLRAIGDRLAAASL